MPQPEPRRRRREQVVGVELLELRVARGVVRHLRDDADAHAELDVGLDHVGVERGQHDVGLEALGGERRVDRRAPGEAEVVGDDRKLRERLERERLRSWRADAASA